MKLGFLFGALTLSGGLLQAETEAIADFLVWCANEVGAENWAQVFTTQNNTLNVDLQSVSFGCDFGFRVGLKYCTCCDDWDVLGTYTWFRANGKDSAKTNGEIASAFLGNFYINNVDGANVGPSYRKASIDWKINYNIFDAELGRLFCASECLTLRPFIGLKGGWIDQSIDTRWKHPTDHTFVAGTEDLKNDFWGIGPSAGLNLDWLLCGPFSLFNDLSGALMYGHWTFKDRYQNDQPETIVIEVPAIDGAAAMMRDFIGVAWKWECGCFSTTIRLGYETQIWLSQFKLYTLNLGRPNNVLTFQGGALDVRFAF